MTTMEKFRQKLGLSDKVILGLPEEIQGQISDGGSVIIVGVELHGDDTRPVRISRDKAREAWEESLV